MAKKSPEEKLVAVQRYINGKESSRKVAEDFGISHLPRALRSTPTTVLIRPKQKGQPEKSG